MKYSEIDAQAAMKKFHFSAWEKILSFGSPKEFKVNWLSLSNTPNLKILGVYKMSSLSNRL